MDALQCLKCKKLNRYLKQMVSSMLVWWVVSVLLWNLTSVNTEEA